MREDSTNKRIYAVKMRAAAKGAHVSGAERITALKDAAEVARSLVARAATHSKGVPDFINVKIEAVANPLELAALPVTTRAASTLEEGWRIVRELLAADGIGRADEILALFSETSQMRGAMLLDADTIERLEPDRARGVRATYMDAAADAGAGEARPPAGAKNHFAEALVLATKVANAPNIIGEICMSDDPDYVTGYVASKRLGYVRITCLKQKGDPSGGRIFLYRGARGDLGRTVEFLERRAVLVAGVPAQPASASAAPAVAPSPLASLADELDEIRAAGLWRETKVCDAPRKAFADNDYLGLAKDPRLVAASVEATKTFGAGSAASRLLTGTKPPHARLEAHLAAFKGTEDALVWATGYMANVGTIAALVGKGDAVFSDELNHASIVDGCRLSKADVFVYRHNDMADLAAKIAAAGPRRRRLAVTDAVFSMDGDIVDLPKFLAVCAAAGAISMIDEAHSTGVLGATGRGVCEHFGCAHPDIMMGTLSKALGAEGGYVCASRLVCDYLRNKSRSFIFSTAPAPGPMAAADAALTILEAEPRRAVEVRRKAADFAARLTAAGVSARTESAIVPVVIGDERRAVAVSRALSERGFVVPAIRYPTVAKGAARLRVSISATSAPDDLDALADAIADLVGGRTDRTDDIDGERKNA